VSFTAGPPEFSVFGGYVHLTGDQQFDDRDQVSGGVTNHFADYWATSFSAGYDLDKERVNAVRGSIGYNDECFGMNLSAQYTPEADTDTSSGRFAAFITFSFKNLGNFGTSF